MEVFVREWVRRVSRLERTIESWRAYKRREYVGTIDRTRIGLETYRRSESITREITKNRFARAARG